MFDKQQQQPIDDIAQKRSRTKHDLEHQKTRLRRISDEDYVLFARDLELSGMCCKLKRADDHRFEFVLRTSTIGQSRRTLRCQVYKWNANVDTRAAVRQIQKEINGERFRSVENLNKLKEATGRDLKSGNCVGTLFCEVLE